MNIVHTIRRRTTAIIIAATIALTGTATAHAAETKPVDVFVGDSLSSGYGLDDKANQRWTHYIADNAGHDEVNVAVTGTGYAPTGADKTGDHTVAEQARQAADKTKGRDVARVFVESYVNDYSVPETRKDPVAYQKLVADTITQVKDLFPRSEIYVIPSIFVPSPGISSPGEQWQQKPMLTANIQGASSVDGVHVMDIDTVYDIVQDKDTWQADSQHPNAKGHRQAADSIQAWLDRGCKPKDGTIHLDPNGGTGTMDDITAPPHTDVTLPQPMFGKDGYYPAKWNTKPDGTGTMYLPGATRPMPYGTSTLYAIWAKAPLKPTDKAVDVFIGDSSMAGIATAQRWTTLLAAKDNATPIDVSMSGAGFIAGVTFDKQQDQAIQRIKGKGLDPAKDVKRVFVDGGINDLSALQKDPSKILTYADTATATLTRIKDAYPNAQLLFSPSIGVQNPTTEETAEQTDPYLSQLNQGAAKLGYRVKDPWPFMAGPDPDYKLVYSKTNMHMNKEGHKQAAERIAAWIDTLDGPKVGETAGTTNPKPTTFTVTFDSAEGSKVAPVKVEQGKPVSKPADPTRDGWTFDGWTLDGKTYDFATPVTRDITLTAVWEKTPMKPTGKPVDVFIGDSSAVNGAYSDGTTAEQRWTRLFADADGADEANVAVGGTGFIVGNPNTFKQQTDKAAASTKGRTVRRVFVVGIGNDMSRIQNGQATQAQLTQALMDTMPRIAAAWPDAQKLYVPEASPMTANMQGAYQRMQPHMGQIYTGLELLGFTSMERWDTLVDGDGTSKDGTHLNRKGNNLMAHAIQDWVNTLDGPKVTGTIPEWKDTTDPTPTPKTHTVTFDSADGSKVEPQSVEDGKPVAKPADPTRDGYEFKGWLLDGKAYDFATPVSKDITLTASWERKAEPTPTPKTHTVTFDTHRDGMSVPPQKVEDGKTAKPVTLESGMDENESTYWTFSGWTLDGKPYDFTQPVTRDITLVAAWGVMPAERVKVTFDSQGGTSVPMQRMNIGDRVSKPADPTKDGYGFKGWQLDGQPYDFTVPVTHDITLTASWEKTETPDPTPTSHTVTFDTGQNGPKIEPQSVEDGKTVSKPQDPTKDGYEFKGWLLDGKAYDFTSPVTRDLALTAAWAKEGTPAPVSKTFTVTFDTGEGSKIDPQKVEQGKTVSKPTDPTRDGYGFKGWLLNGQPYDLATPVTRDITLTASWAKEKEPTSTSHTVTFDTTGGPKINPVKVEDGKPVAKPADPTRDGWTFAGWTLDGKAYDFATPVSKDLTLTATWRKTGTPEPSTLPSTGADPIPVALLAIGILTAGIATLAVARRKH